jgi:hypothetical protein
MFIAVRYFDVFEGVNEYTVYLFEILKLLLVLFFLVGIKKQMIYGLVFLLHGAPALLPFTKYNDVFNNLLFFSARPISKSFFTLYLFRDEYTKFDL